ncbi:MAG TPA: DEAD/DEAH box helicase family protein, partial [Candidatus Paceibacterota bacterium]|nr:DEAD/DEAH box helicase family protein [Candidatus Paceibacterota bacterium]
MTNKYKNNSEDMHLVAESLNEFQLFENMEEAKKVFSNMGFDENSEEWKDFKKAFEVEPDLADKFAKWLEPEVDNEDFLSDFRSVIDSFERAQEENVSYDELNSFTSLTQYLRGIDRIIYRRKLQKAEKESEETLSKKEEELQELQNLVENPEILIDKLNLHKVGNALYCSESVWLTGDIQKRGQGVYIWTDLILLRNWDGKSKNLKTKFKFGQYGSNVIKSAEREEDIPIQGKDLGLVGKKAYETIESYSGTSIGTKVIIYVNDLTDFLKDDPRFEKAIEIENLVRTKIIDSDKKPWALYTPAKSKEVYFGGTLGDLEIEINEVITGVAKQESFKMKDEQKNAYNKIISALVDNNKDEFLLAAKMRFGKNFTVLNVIKQLNELYPDSNFKNTLVTTYKPAVFVSLEKDIENHTSFDGWEIIDLRNNSNLPGDKNKIRIFVASAQWALHKGSNKELESLDYDEETRQELEKRTLETLSKNIQKLKSINFGLIVADEYHYGTKSNNFNKLLEELNYEKIIWVSGTAMKDLATGRFEDDQIYQWSYIEEQKKREKELKEREKNPNGYYPNINMPKMHFYKMNLSKKAQDLAHDRGLYSADQGFSFKKLIEVDKDKRLVNEPLMRTLLEQIVGTDYGHLNSVMKAQGVRGNLDHTFWVFARSILGIEATADLMRSMPEFKNYEIIEATGGKNTSIQNVKRKIKESAANGKKSITLSCYRFKEGTTVPWWNGVIMLDGGHSAEEYL